MELPLYTPSPWGQRFHDLEVDEALGAGAAGPGKSMVLLMDPMQQVMLEHARGIDIHHPHHFPMGMSRGWALHLRRTRPMLEQTLARAHRMFPVIDSGVRYNADHTTFTFSSGYKYEFGHCQKPDDWQLRMSNEYTWIGFDELVQFEEMQYEQISGRLRSSDPLLVQMLKVRSMSNPMLTNMGNERIHVNNPQWVRIRFVDPAPEGEKILEREIEIDGEKEWITRIYLPATLDDNPDPVFVRSYKKTLLGKSEFTQAALLYGDWYAVAGSYFGGIWNRRLHVCRPFRIPTDWPVWRSMDWGFKAPGVVHWWAMDPDGNVYCIKEYTFKGKTDKEVARVIEMTERELGFWRGRRSGITGVADDQLWEDRGDTGKSKAANMSDCGVDWLKADKKSRRTNGIRVFNRLEDHEGGATTAGLVFMENCPMVIRTLPAIQTDPDDPETPMDGGEDHWLDSTMYSVAYASHGSLGIPRLRDEDDGWDDEGEPSGSRGRTGYGM